MKLDFLPVDLQNAIAHLNYRYLTEIRLRCGQAVMIEYRGEYKYINRYGETDRREGALTVGDVQKVLYQAMEGNVFSYTEQLKNAFITVRDGVRIGIAGEYVTEHGKVITVRTPTSLNIRIAHDVDGCSSSVYGLLFDGKAENTLVFSPPGYGKTTILRDLARKIGENGGYNVLIFDERRELSGMDGCAGFDLGGRVDVVRCSDKLTSIANAVRAMKPQVIVTDELYGERDFEAVSYAVDCGLKVVASSHLVNRAKLKETPFDYFVELTGIGNPPLIYDKDFNALSHNRPCNDAGMRSGGR